MLYEFSLPTKANQVPAGDDWIHEIKHDGYRMMVVRDQDQVRLISRGGYDWADRFPSSRKHDKRAQLYAFDMLAGDGEDYRSQALLLRKANLAKLLKRSVDGIFIAEYEQGDIGEVLFRVACNMGLEGIVSKRLDRAYGAGRCKILDQDQEPGAPGLQQGAGLPSIAPFRQIGVGTLRCRLYPMTPCGNLGGRRH